MPPGEPPRLTLVLGASGFLGPHVVAAAVARSEREATLREPLGPPVVAQSRGPSLLVPRFTNPRDAAEWIERDLTAPGLEDWLTELAPTEVVNCVALARARDCEEDPARAALLNVDLPRRVAEWCGAHDGRMVHVSTDLVFGGDEPPETGFDESAEPNPLSEYGRSKLAGERAVQDTGANAVVTRLPLLYGDSGGRELGASDSIIGAVDRGDRPRLFVDEWRTPLEASCAARAIVELLDFDGGGVLHLAGPDRVSRFDFGIATLRAMGLEEAAARAEIDATSQSDVDTGAKRARDVSLDASRARELLDTELVGVRAGLRASIEGTG